MSKNYRHRRRRRLAEYQDNNCFFCDEKMLFVPEDTMDGNHPLVASDDHFIPKSKGGRGTLANLVIAHRDCNSKHTNLIKDEEYEEKLRLLNIKRGFDDSKATVEPFGSLDTYMDSTPASVALFDKLNQMPSQHIPYARKIIIKIFNRYHFAVKQFKAMPDPEFRYKMFRVWLDVFLKDRVAAIDLIQHHIDDEEFVVYQYLQNIFVAYAKRKLLGKSA